MQDKSQGYTFGTTKIHEEYDNFTAIIPHYYTLQQRLGEYISKILETKNEIYLLDVGCGTGITSEYVIKNLSPEIKFHLTAVDSEKIMLDQYKEKINSKYKNSKITTVEADIFDYINNNNKYDIIFSAWVLHNFQENERQNLYKKFYNSIKPSGVFINVDKIAVDNPEQHQEHLNWQLEQILKMDNSELSQERYEHYAIIDEHPTRVMKEKDTILGLKEAGFSQITINDRTQMEAICIAHKL